MKKQFYYENDTSNEALLHKALLEYTDSEVDMEYVCTTIHLKLLSVAAISFGILCFCFFYFT